LAAHLATVVEEGSSRPPSDRQCTAVADSIKHRRCLHTLALLDTEQVRELCGSRFSIAMLVACEPEALASASQFTGAPDNAPRPGDLVGLLSRGLALAKHRLAVFQCPFLEVLKGQVQLFVIQAGKAGNRRLPSRTGFNFTFHLPFDIASASLTPAVSLPRDTSMRQARPQSGTILLLKRYKHDNWHGMPDKKLQFCSASR
jgi:hypothetical protein